MRTTQADGSLLQDRDVPETQAEYEMLRRHGLGHEAALEAAGASEPYRCWCGKEQPCEGGAQRLVGCPVWIGSPPFEHVRHRRDFNG